MSISYRLSQTQIDDLETIFHIRRSDSLVEHYIEQKHGLYHLWLVDLQDDVIDILNRQKQASTFKYTDEEIIEGLTGRMMRFDSHLKRLFRGTNLERLIGYSREEVCDLFAHNIAAINPVAEG